jgi:hypothetical protein
MLFYVANILQNDTAMWLKKTEVVLFSQNVLHQYFTSFSDEKLFGRDAEFFMKRFNKV